MTLESSGPAVKPVQAVLNGLAVLDAVAELQPVGVSDAARATALDKSGVQRQLVTLHEAGWIRPRFEGTTRWELTAKALLLARRVRPAGLLERARSVLDGLRDSTGETAMLATLDADRLVVVGTAESSRPVRMALPAGAEIPFEGSAAGRAVLAHLPDATARRLLHGDPPPETGRALAVVRERGYAANTGEVSQDAHAVAAAVLDRAGSPVAALVVAAPAFRSPERRLAEYGALVAAAAETLHEPERPGRAAHA